MSRIDELNARYRRSVGLVRNGVELIAVGDPASARVNAAIRQVLVLARDDTSGLCDDLLGAAKALRWRLATQPQPLEFNAALRQGAREVTEEAAKLRLAVAPHVQHALGELVAAVDTVVAADPFGGSVLLESIQDVGAASCVVIAANGAAAAGLESWLGPSGVAVRGVGQLARDPVFVEQGYAVGPPRFFPSSLVTAPTTEALSYFVPAWFGDQSIPRSELATYAEGAVQVKARLLSVGDTSEPFTATTESVEEADLLPQPTWIAPNAPAREPGTDEVAAHRVLLSGGYAILLDDGERIRAVDPRQPGGERVTYVDVNAVSPGTYLLLRDGETERRALYDAALKLMGAQAEIAAASQNRWKGELQSRLNQYGQVVVARELAKLGVRTLDRLRAWTEPTLARPRSNRDFESLLQWLGIPVHPAYELATALRRKRAQASANIADQLEKAVGAADMSVLERDGHLRLDVKAEGFRGVIATRVLAISPHVEIVSRHDARVLIEDRGAKWLE